MKTAFYNECGKSVREFSQTDMRFKAAASEIFAVSSLGDYIFKQSFPQTAEGESLDRHAAVRDIKRKSADFAKGFLTFRLAEENEKEVVIPKGTVCSEKGLAYVQFSTDEAAVIAPGELEATAPATALRAGGEFNSGAYSVTVMVNPPEYISEVFNESDFIGGCDEECDESLRERILSSYSTKNNGVNASSVRQAILSVEGVLDASVMPDSGRLLVFVRTSNGRVSEKMKDEITQLLGFASLCGVPLSISPASGKAFSVSIEARALSGFDREALKKEISQRAQRYCKKCKIGENISSSALSIALCTVQGVSHFDISIKADDGGAMVCGSGEYLEPSKITVALYE